MFHCVNDSMEKNTLTENKCERQDIHFLKFSSFWLCGKNCTTSIGTIFVTVFPVSSEKNDLELFVDQFKSAPP